ncbi:multicomponent Na+:H+ antiporter subunit F [Microcella alkaliphila]|uniref:Multicomponent Na+:H+ antiporter subunit F n=1 Tax=Microcella alkaliphila TaxID=279828 RepID=A0A4V6MCD9_9MICO|nr:monovalent cation/H+ antiporter complex subunit F [Microcella alkaliphila]RZT64229.1 multicomponent Na+:H+ antiporter subunit F [Microcella alkaliphila]
MIHPVVAVIVVIMLIAAVAVAVVRIVVGPTKADSAIAGDLILFAFMGLMVVFGLLLRVDAVLDIILVAAILGFLSILSLARLLQGRKR